MMEHRGPYPPINYTNIMSKHWEFAGILPLSQPPVFWKGDTGEIMPIPRGVPHLSIKTCLSLSLTNQSLIPNLIVTLIVCSKKFYGLFWQGSSHCNRKFGDWSVNQK